MIELQDIIQVYGDDYIKDNSLLPVQHKVLRAIRDCRTAALGGHVDHFDCVGIPIFLITLVEIAIAPNVKVLKKSVG